MCDCLVALPPATSPGATLFAKGRYSATPAVSFRSSRAREQGDSRPKLPGYGLVGLTLRAMDVWRTLTLALSAQNLFDEAYFDPSLRFIDRFAFLDGLHHFDVLDGHRIDLQRILVEDDKVGELSFFE